MNKEHEFLVSKVEKLRAEVELHNYEKHYKEQASMLNQLQDKSTQQHMLILQKEKELKSVKTSLSQAESKSQEAANKAIKEAETLRNELTKQKTENQLMLREKLEKAKQEYKQQLSKEKSVLEEQIQAEREKLHRLESIEAENKKEEEKRKDRARRPEREKRELNLLEFRRWDSADVYYWLCDIEEGRLQEWAEILYMQDITGDLLTELNGEDLDQMGIEALGARKQILKHITLLRRSANESMSMDTYDSRFDGDPFDAAETIYNNMSNMSPKHRKMLTSRSISMVEEYDPQLAVMQKQILSNPDIIADPRFLMSFMQAYSSSQLSLGNIPKLGNVYSTISTVSNSVINLNNTNARNLNHNQNYSVNSSVDSPVTVTVVNLDANKKENDATENTAANNEIDSSNETDTDAHQRNTSQNSEPEQSRSRSSDGTGHDRDHIKSPSANSHTNTENSFEDDLDDNELNDIEKYETLKKDALKRLKELQAQKSPRAADRAGEDDLDGLELEKAGNDDENGRELDDLDRILRPVASDNIMLGDDSSDSDADGTGSRANEKNKNEKDTGKTSIEEKLKLMDELIKSKFSAESDEEDSDEQMELDYEEIWLEENENDENDVNDDELDLDDIDENSELKKSKNKSLNICLLSPYKRLRKAMIRMCFDADSIDNRTRTAAYKKYEKVLKCGDTEFTFRMIEIYDPTYIAEMFEKNLIHSVWIIYPFDIASDTGSVPEKEEFSFCLCSIVFVLFCFVVCLYMFVNLLFLFVVLV